MCTWFISVLLTPSLSLVFDQAISFLFLHALRRRGLCNGGPGRRGKEDNRRVCLGLTKKGFSVVSSPPPQAKLPCLLAALHAATSTLGCHVLVRRRKLRPAKLKLKDQLILFAFSILYTVNIIVSNLSL